MKKIWQFFRSIKYGIENLIKWFPVIWQDRDWDQWFIYKIFQFKLHQVEKLQRKYGNSTNSKKYADQIKLAVLLFHRLIEDEYLQNVLKPHEEKWGEVELIFTPIDPTEGDEGFSTVVFKVANANTEEEKEQENKERMILYKHSDVLRQQDLNLLFKHMRKYIEYWWD